ncbi:MAG TPA: YihY/virulence factor BrkB family protein [Bryobacteraceae bacterium]|nr:YihY/virulence factor BrkB family protein [Bryobacteraceae bacterium]
MPRRLRNLWTLGGLSLPELLHRTARESWQDAVFGQGGRMAFYQFLAIFPSLLVLLAISTRIPHFGIQVKNTLQELSRQVLPDQAAQLFDTMVDELYGRAFYWLQLLTVVAGTLWAALNGTYAMIWGLNRAYEVEEQRPWWKLALTIVGLTLSMAVTACIALFFVFFGTQLQAHLPGGPSALRLIEWLVVIASLSLSFGLLYRFGPSVPDHEWRWSTPGALCALILWIATTFAARLYFDRINNYSRSYGHLNGVVILLLWLYVTNGAILIGGEMNSEIEKNAGARHSHASSDKISRS